MTPPAGDPSDGRPSRYAHAAAQAGEQASAAASNQTEISDHPASSRRAGRPRRRRRAPAGRRLRAFTSIARLTGPPAVLALIITLALIVALGTLAGTRTLIVNAWLLSIGALMLWTCWRVLTAALPSAADSAFDSVRIRPTEAPSKLFEVIAIEGVLLDAEWSWRDVEYRLRPLLRRIAASRLIEGHLVDLEADPAAAHRILGPELWALVGPGAYGPMSAETPDGRSADAAAVGSKTHVRPATEPFDTRHGRGIPRATIRRAIEQLEAL